MKKKTYTGLRIEKVSFDGVENVVASSPVCTLMVAYNDNDHSGLCDEAEIDPVNGNFMEYYMSPGP